MSDRSLQTDGQTATRFDHFCSSFEPLLTPGYVRFAVWAAIAVVALNLVAAVIATVRPPDPAVYPQVWAFPVFWSFWYVSLYPILRIHRWKLTQGSSKERFERFTLGRYFTRLFPEWFWTLSDFMEQRIGPYFLTVHIFGPLVMTLLVLVIACT
jgi:hypothetical protein